MNIEEIDELGKSVTNEAQARSACLVKWREAQVLAGRIGTLSDRNCGFCHLADKLKGKGYRCFSCPKKVKEFCDELLGEMTKLTYQIETKIGGVIRFLNEYEVTDGSEVVP